MNSGGFTHTVVFHKDSQGQIGRLHELYKTIVRNRIGKKIFHMYLNVVGIKALRGPESTVMKQNHYGDNFAGTHFGWPLGGGAA